MMKSIEGMTLVEVERPLANAICTTDAVIITRTGDHNGDN